MTRPGHHTTTRHHPRFRPTRHHPQPTPQRTHDHDRRPRPRPDTAMTTTDTAQAAKNEERPGKRHYPNKGTPERTGPAEPTQPTERTGIPEQTGRIRAKRAEPCDIYKGTCGGRAVRRHRPPRSDSGTTEVNEPPHCRDGCRTRRRPQVLPWRRRRSDSLAVTVESSLGQGLYPCPANENVRFPHGKDALG